MKVWTTKQIVDEAAQVTPPYWVNLADLQSVAEAFDYGVGKLQRMTPGNCSHTGANVTTVLGAWRDRLLKLIRNV